MATAQGAANKDELSRGEAIGLALWLGILLPIVTVVQLSYVSSYLTKLQSWVVAAIAFMMIAMVTLSLWAAIGLFKGSIQTRDSVERALLFAMAANMLCCAPLSILMSAPPTFLPAVIVTLISMALLDTWHHTDT